MPSLKNPDGDSDTFDPEEALEAVEAGQVMVARAHVFPIQVRKTARGYQAIQRNTDHPSQRGYWQTWGIKRHHIESMAQCGVKLVDPEESPGVQWVDSQHHCPRHGYFHHPFTGMPEACPVCDHPLEQEVPVA